jgi:translation initiation factor IF-2
MSKIRINELARELEVKPNRILELLPELGVTEKKTHSSSIDEDIAAIIKRRLGLEVDESAEPVAAESSSERGEFDPVPVEEPAAVVVAEPVAAPPPALSVPPPVPLAPEPIEVRAVIPSSPELTGRPTAPPLRPPVGASKPVVPPVGPTARAPVIPGKPVPSAVPTPKPGQILTGPRQPLPATAPEPPRPPVAAPPPQAAAPAIPPMPARPVAPARPAATSAPAQRPTLAGQPVPRPVVPPRPDLVARLAQQPKAAVPGQPISRTARPGAPMPGQPIYRGPIRPGQPMVRGPMAPGSGMPGARMLRPRGPGAMPIAEPPPTEAGRRHQAKPKSAVRQREEQEGKLHLGRKRADAELPQAVNKEITISEGITVKELSEKLGIKASLVIKRLVDKKVFATINQTLDLKMAEDLARDFGASAMQTTYEEETTFEVEMAEESKDLVRRAPVVTVMGHVDHGKTSLLDAIREANVAAREAGGITQHIGAYKVYQNDRKIVFIDTPGHEAFTRMRARGAKVTDIVVLVVAADDGVMPQTREAIDHARAANVPIVVAINKIDKPDANPDRIKKQLAELNLLPEEYGGQTVMVEVSAKTKHNLDLLLEMILLTADLLDLKCNPARPAVGTVLEAELDRGRGPVARVLVRNGTLRVGDFLICGTVFAKVRALVDDLGQPIRDAEPATPVEVIGLDALPEVGETVQVVTDTAKAKQIVVYRESQVREQQMARGRVSLERLHEQLREGGAKELNVILKADVGGSAEVISEALQKLSTDKVKIRVLHTGVGAITETDVLFATASEAIIIGFNVRPDRNAAQLAETEKVDVRLHTIIYELTQEIKKAMAGLLEPVFKENYLGRAAVRETFRISKVGTVAGCYVQDGVIKRNAEVRLLRDNVVVHTGRIDSLKRFKDDASEVKTGLECGISIAGFNDVKPGDVIECFQRERVEPATLV